MIREAHLKVHYIFIFTLNIESMRVWERVELGVGGDWVQGRKENNVFTDFLWDMEIST